jgi:hypothetical protein
MFNLLTCSGWDVGATMEADQQNITTLDELEMEELKRDAEGATRKVSPPNVPSQDAPNRQFGVIHIHNIL